MAEFKAVKKKAGLSKKYIDTYWRSFFVPFRDAFKDCVITDVTAEAVEKYIYKNEAWNATTRATVIRHLSVLFNFAVGRGYVTMNPFRSIQKPKKSASTPETTTPLPIQVLWNCENARLTIWPQCVVPRTNSNGVGLPDPLPILRIRHQDKSRLRRRSDGQHDTP